MSVSYWLRIGVIGLVVLAGSSCLGAVRVESDWNTARSVLSQERVRKKILLRLKHAGTVKGRLVSTSEDSIHIFGKQKQIIAASQIHSIRVVPLSPRKKIHRVISIIAGVPAGIGVGLIAAESCCDILSGDGGESHLGSAVFFAAWAGAQALLYRIGSRFDRGSILIVLSDDPKPDLSGVLQELVRNPSKGESQ